MGIKNDDSIINNTQIPSIDKNNNVESKNVNIEKNDLFREGIADDYFQNTEIVNELQANGTDNIQSRTLNQQNVKN
ncbi:MAG TPA: hypothetical protein VFI73_06890 [Candidatus Nitrosopolaris sp.]|nr:hypothetical protein [Candidatus Nitrosopolaris sp.]